MRPLSLKQVKENQTVLSVKHQSDECWCGHVLWMCKWMYCVTVGIVCVTACYVNVLGMYHSLSLVRQLEKSKISNFLAPPFPVT